MAQRAHRPRTAGAAVVDEQVVTDGDITTSRSPDDLSAFCECTLQVFASVQQPASAGRWAGMTS